MCRMGAGSRQCGQFAAANDHTAVGHILHLFVNTYPDLLRHAVVRLDAGAHQYGPRSPSVCVGREGERDCVCVFVRA
jgi:hypothetical protein